MSVKNAAIEEVSRKRHLYDIILLVLSLIGIGIAGYLTYSDVTNQSIICTTGNGCDIVNRSSYAYFLGIPVAVIGLLVYICFAIAIVARWRLSETETEEGRTWRNWLDWGLFLFSLIGIIFSYYLIAMSLFVIKATCIWCLGSATTMTILFILLAVRLWRSVEYV